ncbi:penicillin-binding protein 1A [Pseudomonas saudimassiliensis]|uniref:Penicillin-binding protein 1A n=1 Tax=Pseudomonas saudimassiliensis TaxID=1461581 RepID=A0A078M8Q8_9PSED|nr:penicillin-binding protein 1A [Pseudomonas saudimassiliensis]CEA03808.1 penicillin-binding protein 1A [Pseudomonas saudimassiliensis]CEF26312.1 penicillin-binding protein 1A [Pseudomonas saudimassiliensis]
MRFLIILFWLLVAIASAPLLAISGVALYLSPTLPDVDTLRDVKLQTPLRIYSADRKLIAEFGEMRRLPITFDQVPQGFIDAILAAEDDNFLNHHGVDPMSLLRATSELLSTGQIQTGGSTITMQVAKNYFLSSERVFSRKLNEILLALQIERNLSKREIFELYVNKIYLGNRAYGIEAAAHVYYGKPIAELPLAELAMIAGLPKAPSAYNPVANPERARIRRDWILQRMLQLGSIDQAAYDEAIAAPITARNHGANPELEAPYVAEMARLEMLERFGTNAYIDGYHVYTAVDSKLQTLANQSLRAGLMTYDQRHGYRGPEARHPEATPEQWQQVLRSQRSMGGLRPAIVSEVGPESVSVILRNGERGTISWEAMRWARPYLSANSMGPNPRKPADVLQRGDLIRVQPLDQEDQYKLAQIPQAQSALVVLSPETGAIQALTGGFSFVQSNYNRVTQARRQPGSSFKPFLYSAALDHGYTPASLVNDAPLVFSDGTQGDDWRPRNSSGDFLGPIRLREAFYRSRNLVSIRLMRDIGIDESLTYMERFGFNRDELPRNLSASLGTPELTPLQIATGYAVIANGGHAVRPWLIERIENSEHQVIDFARPAVVPAVQEQEQRRIDAYVGLTPGQTPPLAQVAEQVIDPRTTYQLTSMLKDVINRGTGARARSLERSDLGGKTGTTNDQKDGWFAGFNGDHVAAVWVGFDQPATLGRREYGGTTALPIWMDFMAGALEGKPEHDLEQPEGLMVTRIDPLTGRSARPGTPGAYLEIFKEEDIPPPASELDAGGYSSDGGITPLELF